ncbi:ribosome-inactivating family protein [Streptomyces collinus]|uniref:ribosome-inactivating family protein n=1 Tax=Streptomyces collinus TaxID=42684 RepID=UPI0036A9731A
MLSHITRRIGVTMVLPAVLAGGLVVAGQHSPSAGSAAAGPVSLGHIQKVDAQTTTNNIVANFNSGSPTSWVSTYNSVIAQIRNRATRGTLREGILNEVPANNDDYFAVHFQEGVGNPQVSVVFNAANMYVVGYYNHARGEYIRMGAGPDRLDGATTVNNFLTRTDYTYLESRNIGNFDRGTPNLGIGALSSAIDTLADRRPLRSVPATQLEAQARAITTIIQMFSEGARFDFISANIARAAQNGQGFTAATVVPIAGNGADPGQGNPTVGTVTAIDFENDWARLSQYVRGILITGGAVNFAVGQFLRFTTVQGIANQLAISYSG